MKRLIVLLLMAIHAQADLATCLYFYKPLTGLNNFTPTSTQAHTNLNLILRNVLNEHISAKEITPEMTVAAFANFVDLVDPGQILISREDLKKVGYPSPSLYGDIQYNLVVNGRTSPQHLFLLRLMNERLDSYTRKFLHNESFRMQVLERAKQLVLEPSFLSQNRPLAKVDIENRVIDFLASQVITSAQHRAKTDTPEIRKSDLAFMIKFLREHIEIVKENLPIANLEPLVIKSYLKTFDHHSDLILPRERRIHDETSGKTKKAKIGTVSYMTADGIVIDQVIKGGAAEKAGIQPNDLLLAYELETNSGVWQSFRSKTVTEFGKIAAGEPGTQLRVRVRRGTNEFEALITRQIMAYSNFVVSTRGVRETPQGPIVNIRLSEFTKDSASRLKEEISKHLSKDIKGIILDLRGNGGGLVNEMSDILQLFVSRPHSMYAKSRNALTPYHPMLLKLSTWDGPLVVLVDQSSASASEALSAALKSYKRAIIVGGPHTYGKGSMQDFKVVHNILFKYTSALFYSPNGLPIQWRGVDADIPLPIATQYSLERDNKNSLKPKPLIGGISHAWPVVTNLDSITSTLKAKSVERLQKQEVGQTPEEIYNQNTEEAYRILTDWVEIDPSGNGGW